MRSTAEISDQEYEEALNRMRRAYEAGFLFLNVDLDRAIRRLLRERDELAKDAARYRWLRDREIPEWLDLWHQNPDRIDDAIDAAMAGREGEG